jgi:hypothetical protein
MLEDRLLQVLQDNEGQVAKVLSTLQEHGVKITDVSVQNKSIRDNYFDRHKDLYDKLEENCFEDVEVDRARWIRNDRDIDGTCSVEDLEFAFDAIEEYAERDANASHISADGAFVAVYRDKLVESIKDMTLDGLAEEHPTLYQDILGLIEDFDNQDMQEYALALYGIDDIYDECNIGEALAYWTTFFSPCTEDEDVAWEVGLIPFWYDGDLYLALGGCGMDLSPKLDAYQALVAGSVPSGSRFLSAINVSYCKSVVGADVYERVMEKIACSPVITLSTD